MDEMRLKRMITILIIAASTSSTVKTTTTLSTHSTTVSWSPECGPNWISGSNSDTCYQVIVSDAKTWIEARADCLTKGSDLVSIDEPQEQSSIQAMLSNDQHAAMKDLFWIGANDRRNEGQWEWSNQAPFRYFNWRTGEVANASAEESCSVIALSLNYQWESKACSQRKYYICEKPMQVLPKPTKSEIGKCKVEPMISGNYSLPYGQGALQASSSRDQLHGAEASRLAPSYSAWSASTTSQNEWVSATFTNIISVHGIRILGRRDTNEWVTRFKLMYQYEYFSPWYTYQDPPGIDKEYSGNKDSHTTEEVTLTYPVKAKTFKLLPTAWYNGISLMWEILGCNDDACPGEYAVSGPLFVSDGDFTSSSILDLQHSSHNSRLHPNGSYYVPSCWKPKISDQNPWLDVDLEVFKVIRGVTTVGNPAMAEWVTKYKVMYKLMDGSLHYYTYQEPYGTDHVFIGNTDNNTPVTHLMKSFFKAQHVRISVQAYHSAVAMRVDFLVCSVNCRDVTLINRALRVSGSALTASSSENYEHGPERSRLNQPAEGAYSGGWLALYEDTYQYIQVDLGSIVEVTGVATQGRDDRNQFVQQYKLSSSTDGIHWYPYYEGNAVKLFDGNWDSHIVRKHYLMIPLNVRYVRLWPTAWYDRIALRWELYGCPGPMSGTPIGCYKDIKADLDLPSEALTDPAAGMWPPACIHHCYYKGYLYAGLQNGFECFCGNSYGKYGPASSCSMPCFPHINMKCGGPQANYVYNTAYVVSQKSCKNGWTSYRDDCFMLVKNLRNWSDALTHCQTAGGDLASIINQNVQDFLYSLMTQGGEDVWIGFNDRRKQGFYQWSDQKLVRYTNWYLSYRKQPTYNCVIMNYQTAGWQDKPCVTEHKFICMMPMAQTNSSVQQHMVDGCESGWDGFRWSCYLYLPEARTWINASNICTSQGATLVRIDDKSEQDYLSSTLATKKNQYWTDVTDNLNTGIYMNSDGRTHVSLTNWAKGKPDQNGHQCVALGTGATSGLWYNVFCNSRVSAICERDRVGITQPATQSPTIPIYTGKPGICTLLSGNWKPLGSYCYLAQDGTGNMTKTWRQARKWCYDMGGDLVSVSDMREQLFVQNLVSTFNDSHVWIGLTDIDWEGGFRWSDGDDTTFINWNMNAPSDPDIPERCGEITISNGKWNKSHCDKQQGFVCQAYVGPINHSRNYPLVEELPGYCPPGFTAFGNRCFQVTQGVVGWGVNWTHARELCHGHGQGYDLASIRDARDEAFVTTLIIKVHYDLWLGMRKSTLGASTQWLWLYNNDPMNFTNWARNEPKDDTGKSCVVMTSYPVGKWVEYTCDDRRGYLCETMKKTTIQNPTVSHNPCDTAQDYGWKPLDKACFKHITKPMTWSDASSYCKSQNADLASINSEYEQALVFLLATDNSSTNVVWIGLNDIQKQGRFTWMDKWPLFFNNWRVGESSQGPIKGCVVLDAEQGIWKDENCSKPLGFICKRTSAHRPTLQIPEGGQCPGFEWVTFRDLCYNFNYPQVMNFSAAVDHCKKQNGQLVSIHYILNSQFLGSQIQFHTQTGVWIGMVITNFGYKWSDNTPYSLSMWERGEPSLTDKNGTKEDCVELSAKTGRWNTVSCQTTRGVICQKSMIYDRHHETFPPFIQHLRSIVAQEPRQDEFKFIQDPAAAVHQDNKEHN